METNFNFKSSVCTSIEQSERLLALGLKKETADMVHSTIVVLDNLVDLISEHPWTARQEVTNNWYPAWSLDRLRKLLPVYIPIEDDYGEEWNAVIAFYQKRVIIESEPYWAKGFDKDNLYDNIIDCIEWLIKEGYFNKEYLENGNC